MKERAGICTYCGRTAILDDDHIPPRALCGKPLPSDLVVVPSCKVCNGGASKDDEYFKTVMVLKEGAGSHAEAVAIRDSVFRALAMPAKLRFARRIMSASRAVKVRTPAGIHLGTAPGFTVDLPRLDRVVARVARGLYWHHHERIALPTDYNVTVWSEDGLGGVTSRDLANLRRELVEPVLNNPEHSVGRGVLRYRFAKSDRQHVTAWLLEFYGDVRFCALTLPRDA